MRACVRFLATALLLGGAVAALAFAVLSGTAGTDNQALTAPPSQAQRAVRITLSSPHTRREVAPHLVAARPKQPQPEVVSSAPATAPVHVGSRSRVVPATDVDRVFASAGHSAGSASVAAVTPEGDLDLTHGRARRPQPPAGTPSPPAPDVSDDADRGGKGRGRSK